MNGENLEAIHSSLYREGKMSFFDRIPLLNLFPPKLRFFLLGSTIVLISGVGIYFTRNQPKVLPTQVLCPINPAIVENPECTLFLGQRFERDRYELLPAVELERNQIGLYKNFDEQLVSFTAVGAHPYPQAYSVIYPRDILLYKTERDVTNAEKCPEHLTRYGLCDTPVDQVVFDKGIQGSIDLAISFQIQANPENLQALYDIGGINRFVELFTQVVRSNRQLTTIGSTEADTSEGVKKIENTFRASLENWPLNTLFTIQSLNIRSVVVGQEEYRQKLAAQQAQVAQLSQDFKLLEQQKINLAAEQELAGKRQSFDRNQKAQDAQSVSTSIAALCKNVPPDQCAELIWVLTFGGQIQPFLGETGQLTGVPPARANRAE